MKDLFFAFSDSNKVYTPAEKSTSNKRINFNQLVLKIKAAAPAAIGLTRSIIKAQLLKGSTFAVAKKAAAKHKREIPYFLASGFCPIHHNDKTLTDYNGILQIDIDFKFLGGDKKAIEIKKELQKINYIALAAISPSGYGVKALAVTNNTDKRNHAGVQKQLLKDLSKRLKIDLKSFDSLGLSQPCFIPYDTGVYFRTAPVPFKVDFKEIKEGKKLTDCDTFLAAAPTGEAWDICRKFAKSKGFTLNNGVNHLYFSYFSTCANLLGIQQKEVEQFAVNTGIEIKSNCIEYAYKKYNSSFGRWGDVLLFKSNRKIIQGKTGEKLSEILKGTDVSNTRIIAPTGTGKTFFSLFYIDGFKVFLCPTVALVDNICNDEKYKDLDPLPIHENARNLELVRTSKLIVCTYASFKAVAGKLGELTKDYKLIFDEYHNLTSSTAAHFRLNDLTVCLRIAPRFKSVTMLSGTELFNAHPAINALPIIEIKVPKQKKVFKLINAISSITAVANQMKRAIKKGEFPKVLFNDKGIKLEGLKELLKNYNIAYFNADNKQDDEFKKVVSGGFISNDVQGIVTTTVINEGNNIYNELDYHFIIYGMFHPSEIEQFCNRPRMPKSCTGCIIRSNKRKNTKTYFRASKYAAWLKNSCEKSCKELNLQNEIDENLKQLEFYSRSFIQRLPITKNDFNEYEIDFLQFNNFVFEQEKLATYKDDELLKRELKRYNIEIVETVEDETELTKAAGAAAKAHKKAFKEQREKEYLETLHILEKTPLAYAYANDRLRQRKEKLKGGEKIAYSYFIEIKDTLQRLGAEQITDFIFDELRAAGTKKAKVQLLKRRLYLKILTSNVDYMKSNRMFTIVLKKLIASFTANDVLTSDQIKNRLKECLEIDKSFDLTIFEQERNTKALEVLNMFFEVTPVKRQKDGIKSKKYKLLPLIFGGEVLNRLTKIRGSLIDSSFIIEALKT